jgi:hypothetical protein
LKIVKKIQCEDDAIKILQELINPSSEEGSFSILFEGWPTIQMKIVGIDYSSSLKSSQLRALIKLQETIYYQYELLTGRNESTLTAEEKRALELNVKVGNGCTTLAIALMNLINNILSGSILTNSFMQGVFVCAIIFGSPNVGRYFDRYLYKEENHKQDIIADLTQNNEKLLKLVESTTKALETLSKSAPDSDDIYINETSTKHYRAKKVPSRHKTEKISSNRSSFVLGKDYTLTCSVVGLKDENNGRYECRFKNLIAGEILVWKEKRSKIADSLDHMLRMAFDSKKHNVNIKFQVIKEMRSGAEINLYEIFGKKPRSFKSVK